MLLNNELGVGNVNTLIVTQEKLSEIVLLTGLSALFFVRTTSDRHVKLAISVFCVLDR